MAQRTFPFSDTLYGQYNVVNRIVTSQSLLREYGEQIDVGDLVTLEGIETGEFEIREGITLEDTLVALTAEAEYCFPYGGESLYPAIVLQKRSRVWQLIDEGDVIYWAWAWGDWVNYKSYLFNENNEPFNDWSYKKRSAADPVRNDLGDRVTFASKVTPAFRIDWTTILCDQELVIFLHDYAASWKESAPQTPAENIEGFDTEVYEQRRILYYPLGIGQVNRYGNPVGAIEIEFENFPLEDIRRWERRYGRYLGQLTLVAMRSYPHKIIDQILAGDYSFHDEAEDERDRAYQGITPWGFVQ